MTKKILAAFIFATAALNCLAVDLSKFEYTADITIKDDRYKFKSFDMIPSLYDISNTNLSDIRLIKDVNDQLPYLIFRPNDKVQTKIFTVKTINRATDEKNNAFVTIDMGKKILKDNIKIVTTGSNFRRQVKIEGSDNNQRFFTITEKAYIFAVDNKNRFEKIDFPQNDFRYLRITVSPMTTENNVEISKVLAYRTEETVVEKQSIEARPKNITQDKKNRSTSFEFDLEHKNLPLKDITLEIPNEDFYRYLSISGRNTETHQIKIHSEDNRERFKTVDTPWKHLKNAVIYRYTSSDQNPSQRTNISLQGCKYRHLKITVRNYDDKPIDITSATLRYTPHRIIFEASGIPAVKLYTSNPSALRPKFDISQRISKPQTLDTSLVSISNINGNPLFAGKKNNALSWTERYKIIMFLVLALIVCVLGYYIFRSFRSINLNNN